MQFSETPITGLTSDRGWSSRDVVTLVRWPVLVYQILVDSTPQDDLDPLQRAVMSLTAGGLVDPVSQAERLKIDRSLVERINHDLAQAGRLGGKKATLDDSPATARGTLRLSYVLQSPFTGNLWPVSLDTLLPADVQRKEGRPPTGRVAGRIYPLKTVPLPSISIPAPSPDDIAMALQHRESAFEEVLPGDDDPEQFPDEVVRSAPRFVDRIQDRFIVLALVTRQAGSRVDSNSSWDLVSGWAEDVDAFLHQEALASQQVSDAARKTIEEAERIASTQLLGQHREYLRTLYEQATSNLRVALGEDVLDSLGDERAYLTSMLQSALAATFDPGRERDERERCVSSSQRALESLFTRTQELFAPNEVVAESWRRRTNREEPNQRIRMLAEKLQSEGFVIPEKIAQQSWKSLGSAASGRASLRAMCLVTLFSSIGNPTHPWRRIPISEANDLLLGVDVTAQMRNDSAAHAGRARLAEAQAETAVTTTMAIAKLFATANLERESHGGQG